MIVLIRITDNRFVIATLVVTHENRRINLSKRCVFYRNINYLNFFHSSSYSLREKSQITPNLCFDYNLSIHMYLRFVAVAVSH